MTPPGFAAPNAALNSTINRGKALLPKLGMLGVYVIGFDINPVVPDAPSAGVSLPDAEGMGLGADDLCHLCFTYVGNGGNQAEVAIVEALIEQGTVASALQLYRALFPMRTVEQIEGSLLTALANMPAVATALKAALA